MQQSSQIFGEDNGSGGQGQPGGHGLPWSGLSLWQGTTQPAGAETQRKIDQWGGGEVDRGLAG